MLIRTMSVSACFVHRNRRQFTFFWTGQVVLKMTMNESLTDHLRKWAEPVGRQPHNSNRRVACAHCACDPQRIKWFGKKRILKLYCKVFGPIKHHCVDFLTEKLLGYPIRNRRVPVMWFNVTFMFLHPKICFFFQFD